MRDALIRTKDATIYLVGGLRTALPAIAGLCLLPLVAFLTVVMVGVPWLPEFMRPVRAMANAERRRASRALGREIAEPYAPPGGTSFPQGMLVLRTPSTWRDLTWMVLHGLPGLLLAVLSVGLWPSTLFSLTLPLWWWAAPEGSQSAYITLDSWPKALTMPFVQAAVNILILWLLVPRFARWQARMAEALLKPTSHVSLAERVEQLTETRAEALEAHGAELRRIERDLHDGTQAQLVTSALRLGLADRRFDKDPDEARKLFLEAREGIEEALTQLRTVIRGIYPPILSDRGLPGAIRALAAGQHIPVTVDVSSAESRVPAAVEAAAYFVVAEALTNVAKHSRATEALVSIRRHEDHLRIIVRDDGGGGANESQGSGLAGIRRRVAALDGTTHVASPLGVGTTLEVELPCGS
ncbi:sensor histidine kinase [Actinomadura barringtoniae]|uniref:histidine kinase n=1 Tax=Actinomadura barringtoniae TaxID=1427535 RepID=A0A939TAQ3_9ACTN|nr:sensor histidine kinase [Actinomadura barringtoniae]MBO2452707.1 sensor histidine kinase [Actinomadura barringtoniae]